MGIRLVMITTSLALVGCGSDWKPVDADGDGYTVAQGDCWDEPAGPEGSGLSGVDIHPDADDAWYDGFDQNCDGADDFDQDGDGWVPTGYAGQATYGVPGSGALPDGDCWDAPDSTPSDQVAVPASVDTDVDGNPYVVLTAADVNPGVTTDTWYDGQDADCDGTDDFDQDGDGYRSMFNADATGAVGDDCADGSWRDPQATDDPAAVNPAATEVCDSLDNDCDDLVDSADDSVDLSTARTFYGDTDSDGYGDAGQTLASCDAVSGYVEDDTDCDDGDAAVNPGAQEVCNGLDDDCDALIDDDDADTSYTDDQTWYRDVDSDGYGDASVVLQTCGDADGYVHDATDCDDGNAAISPGADEVCDEVDDDCDGAIDDDDPGVVYGAADRWYTDSDGDGYGDGVTEACTPPAGTVATGGDCDDGDAAVNPAATEVCDNQDNDCDSLVDDDDGDLDLSTASTWYADSDHDGYGDPSFTDQACDQPTDYVSDATDCDDGDADISPDGTEICDGADDDCDGAIDDADSSLDLSSATTFYGDGDGDGYGDATDTTQACAAPSGYVASSTDCDDTDSAVSPGADEVCNDGIDNDCDGTTGTTAAGGVCDVVDGTLADANLKLTGDAGTSRAGTQVAAGDFDGDGFPDMVVSAPYADTAFSNAGTVYVVNGGASVATVGSSTSAALSGADAAVTGEAAADLIGQGLAAGDLNGDGYDDLVIGGAFVDSSATDSGSVYIFLGPLSSASVADADVVYDGRLADHFAGLSVDVGDIDGDANADLLIGVSQSGLADGGPTDAGYGYAVLMTGDTVVDSVAAGSASWSSYTVDGRQYGSTSGDAVSYAVAWLDTDADGRDEMLIGAPGTSSDKGGAYVLDNYAGGSHRAVSAGHFFSGVTSADLAGYAVANAGDLDNDGHEDALVGAPDEDSGGADAGAVYVLMGPLSTSGSSILSAADATITGVAAGDELGFSVSGAGDLDGDGNDDIVLGAPYHDGGPTSSGSALVFYGAVVGSLTINDADAILAGESASGRAAWSVAGAGDVNADGYDDLLVGATYDDDGGSNAGAAYLVLGLGF